MKSKPDNRHKTTQDVKNNQQRTLMNLKADEALVQQTDDDALRAELRQSMEHKEQALENLRQKLHEDSEHQQNQLQ